MDPRILPFSLPIAGNHLTRPLDAWQLAQLESMSDRDKTQFMSDIVSTLSNLNSTTGAPTTSAPFGEFANFDSAEDIVRFGTSGYDDTPHLGNPENMGSTSNLPTLPNDPNEGVPSYWRHNEPIPLPISNFANTLLHPDPVAPSFEDYLTPQLLAPFGPIPPEPENQPGTSSQEVQQDMPSSPVMRPKKRQRTVSSTFSVEEAADGKGAGDGAGGAGNVPKGPPRVQAAMLSIIEGDDQGNPVYRAQNPYQASNRQLSECFPDPSAPSSIEVVVPRTRQTLQAANAKAISIRLALGWTLVLLSILNFRCFYFDMIAITDDIFPLSLPKDDVIDTGLVLIISGWISNMVAMRILAGKVPTAASVALFIETCLDSLEVTVILSIAGQIDLTSYTVEQLQAEGWRRLFKPVPLVYYTTRVASHVKQRVLDFYFSFMTHILEGVIRTMTNPRLNPDTAAVWHQRLRLIEAVIDGHLAGSRVHLILSNPSAHPYINHLERHDKYTVHEGTDIALETISQIHTEIRDHREPAQQCSMMFRGGNTTDAVSNAVSFFVDTTPLAISLSYRKNSNPWMDYSRQHLHLVGLLPTMTALVAVGFSSLEHFGSNTSAEKIVHSSELMTTYEKQGLCAGVWIKEALTKGTSANNLNDLKWMNRFISERLIKAIQGREGKRQVWHSGRSGMVFYNPAIPWTTTPLGPQQDMLSFFEGSGTSSGDEDDPRVVKDETFQKSEVTEFYKEALANYRERVANQEAMPDFETLGGEIILKMSHLTPETTGTAWVYISDSLNRARCTSVAHQEEIVGFLRDVPMSPPRRRRRITPGPQSPGYPSP